jgi:L-aminopeptidase/D-esterase-like protein
MRARWCGMAVLLAVVVLADGERVRGQSLSPGGEGKRANATLTSVPGIKVGHHMMTGRSTGCTVILAERGVTAGVDVRGGAPGTRETALLNPVNSVQEVHAISLAGGSAFGLDAATGVMRYLEERQIGFKMGTIVVPIVPAAILIDLSVEGKPSIRPNADCGYQAARSASTAPVPEGSVGAGAGATVGKIAGYDRAMKAGLGSAAIVRPDGLIVAALVAVNARGDVIDPATGRVIAGVRTADGKRLADARALLRSGEVDGSSAPTTPPSPSGRPPAPAQPRGDIDEGGNTTLGVIATNATLTKVQATKVAQMAQDGFARAISPIHTTSDGDTIFVLATGDQPGTDATVGIVGALAAEVMADAIVRAAREATGLPGIPAIRDLPRD